MNNAELKWTYGLMLTNGEMDYLVHDGPLPLDEVRRIIGGEINFVEYHEQTVLAINKHPAPRLPVNRHFKTGVRGDVIVGKMSEGIFVGVLGVFVAKNKSGG